MVALTETTGEGFASNGFRGGCVGFNGRGLYLSVRDVARFGLCDNHSKGEHRECPGSDARCAMDKTDDAKTYLCRSSLDLEVQVFANDGSLAIGSSGLAGIETVPV